MKILVINGPNLKLLGIREPDIYGRETLDSILDHLQKYAADRKVEIETFQSDIEGEIVQKIGASFHQVDGIIINPAAYTHTSVAIRDALAAVDIPAVEVHISNVRKREDFRQISYTAPVCIGQIIGFGGKGYQLALDALLDHMSK